MSTQQDLQSALLGYQEDRRAWQEIRRKDQEIVLQGRRLLETLNDPGQRWEVEDIIFEALQSIETAEMEIQLCNEKITSVQRMQQNVDAAENNQAAIIIAVVTILLVILLFIAVR